MKLIDNAQYIWEEKYRPQCVEDVILPEKMQNQFQEFIKTKKLPNLLFISTTPGTGKTSLVTAIIKELDADVMWVNGSKDANMDLMRGKLIDFGSSVGIDDETPKIVVIDEADGIPDQGQKALRGIIEEFAGNVSFIFTANFIDKLIKPLQNRLTVYDFDEIYAKNKKDIGAKIYKRLQFILNNEGVKFDPTQVQPVVTNFYPSTRQMTKHIQQHTIDGELDITESILSVSMQHKKIMESVCQTEPNFSTIRKAVVELADPGSLYTYMFSHLEEYFMTESIPFAITVIARYQDMHSSARDKHIPATTMLVEMVMNPSILFNIK
jgi:DNA polymerase III gamma/tau subunit